MDCGFIWLVETFTIFLGHWQSPCTVPMAGKLPAIGAVQGDCERVYQYVQLPRSADGDEAI